MFRSKLFLGALLACVWMQAAAAADSMSDAQSRCDRRHAVRSAIVEGFAGRRLCIFWRSTRDTMCSRSMEMIPDGATAFSSEIGQNLTVTFTVPGIYGYRCGAARHARMVGLVVVGNPANEAAAKAAAMPGLAGRQFAKLFEILDSRPHRPEVIIPHGLPRICRAISNVWNQVIMSSSMKQSRPRACGNRLPCCTGRSNPPDLPMPFQALRVRPDSPRDLSRRALRTPASHLWPAVQDEMAMCVQMAAAMCRSRACSRHRSRTTSADHRGVRRPDLEPMTIPQSTRPSLFVAGQIYRFARLVRPDHL